MKKTTIDKNKVKEILKRKGLKNQTELADKIGITKNQLSEILSPKFSPLKSNVERLCDVLDIGFDEIMSVEEIDHRQINFLDTDDIENDNILESTQKDKIKDENRVVNINNNKENNYVDISNVLANRQYTAVELFAGAGGLALGLEEAGFKDVGLVEWDKYAASTLRTNRPEWNVIQGDVVEIAENGIWNKKLYR